MPDDSNNTTDIDRRDFLKVTGATAAAATLSSLLDDEALAQPPVKKGDEVPKRFTIPESKKVLPKVRNLSQVDPLTGYLHTGVNLLPGVGVEGISNTQIILTAAPGVSNDPSAFITTRLIEKKQMTKTKDGDEYLALGETHIEGVKENSLAVMVELKPGQNVQLLKMPGTLIVPEGKGEPLESKEIGYTNSGTKNKRLILIIPPEEYLTPNARGQFESKVLMPARRESPAQDLEDISSGTAAYMRLRNFNEKVTLLGKLKDQVFNTRDAMIKDLWARKKDPEHMPVYSEDEIKLFSGKLYNLAVERDFIKGNANARDGIYEKFIERFKIDMKNENLQKELNSGVDHDGVEGKSFALREKNRDLAAMLNREDPRSI